MRRAHLASTQCHTCPHRGLGACGSDYTDFLVTYCTSLPYRAQSQGAGAQGVLTVQVQDLRDCNLLSPQKQSYGQQQKHARQNAQLPAHIFTPTRHAGKHCRTCQTDNCAGRHDSRLTGAQPRRMHVLTSCAHVSRHACSHQGLRVGMRCGSGQRFCIRSHPASATSAGNKHA